MGTTFDGLPVICEDSYSCETVLKFVIYPPMMSVDIQALAQRLNASDSNTFGESYWSSLLALFKNILTNSKKSRSVSDDVEVWMLYERV